MLFTPERLPSIGIGADVDVAAQILASSQARAFLDGRAGEARTTITAKQIRTACRSGVSHEPFGIRIANALIEGELDLRAMTVDGPLHFVSCVFTHAPRFDGADLHELSITDGRFTSCAPAVALATSELPGLLANGVRTRRDLNLSGSLITGAHRLTASVTKSSAVWLTEAQIGGRMLAVGTQIRPAGDRAMQCDRTRVAGEVRLIRGFRADGEVRLLRMQLDGSLDLSGAGGRSVRCSTRARCSAGSPRRSSHCRSRGWFGPARRDRPHVVHDTTTCDHDSVGGGETVRGRLRCGRVAKLPAGERFVPTQDRDMRRTIGRDGSLRPLCASMIRFLALAPSVGRRQIP